MTVGSFMVGAGFALVVATPQPLVPVATSTAAQGTTFVTSSSEVPSVEADEVLVVTAARLEESVDEAAIGTDVLSRQDIERAGARNVAEALETVPGARVIRDVTGALQIQLRGFESQHVLVIVDGQRVSGRKNGALDLSRLSVERIERIEIVKGPGSAAYGADALGGVVNIITRRAKRPTEADLRVGFGAAPNLSQGGEDIAQAENPELAARVGGRLDRFDYQATGSYRRRLPYDLDPATPAQTGGDVEDMDADLSGGFDSDDATLRLRLDFSRRNLSSVDASPRPNDRFRIDDRTQRIQTFGAHLRPTFQVGKGRLLADASISTYDEEFLREQRRGTERDFERLSDVVAQLLVQYDRWVFNDHHVLVGTEGFFQTVDATRFPSFSDRGRVSGFVQDEWRPSESLSLLAGLRVDYDTQFGVFPTPRVAGRHQLLKQLVGRWSFGLGYKAPLPRDLGILFDNPGVGYQVRGNLDLAPEQSYTGSASVHWQPFSVLHFDLEGFWSEITDLIIPVPLDEDPPAGELLVFIYDNIESATLRGIEAGMSLRPLRDLHVDFGYEFLDTRNNSNGQPLPNRAPHRVTARAGWFIAPAGLDLSLQATWTASRFIQETSEGQRESAEDFVRLDARGQLELGEGFECYFGVDNLLDAGDARFNPILPRNFYTGLQGHIR